MEHKRYTMKHKTKLGQKHKASGGIYKAQGLLVEFSYSKQKLYLHVVENFGIEAAIFFIECLKNIYRRKTCEDPQK